MGGLRGHGVGEFTGAGLQPSQGQSLKWLPPMGKTFSEQGLLSRGPPRQRDIGGKLAGPGVPRAREVRSRLWTVRWREPPFMS